jgi:hypothetical protein
MNFQKQQGGLLMGDISASRECMSNDRNPSKLLDIVRKEIVLYSGYSGDIEIIGEFEYEDGIFEKRAMLLQEVSDLSIVKHLRFLYFNTEVFQVFVWRQKYKDLISISADSREIVLNILNRIEQELSERADDKNGIEECRITDELIRKLAGEGAKLVENIDGGNLLANTGEESCLENNTPAETFKFVHYFLSALNHIARPDALIPVESTVLASVFENIPKAIGIGYAEANLYQAAQRALDYPFFKNNVQENMDCFIFIGVGQLVPHEGINGVLSYLKNKLQGNGILVFGGYIDQKLEGKVTVGILGLDRVI